MNMKKVLRYFKIVCFAVLSLAVVSFVKSVMPDVDSLKDMLKDFYFNTTIKQQDINEETNSAYAIKVNETNVNLFLNNSTSLSSKAELEDLYKDAKKDLSVLEDYYNQQIEDDQIMYLYIQVKNSVGKYMYLTTTLYFDDNGSIENMSCKWSDGSYAFNTKKAVETTPNKVYKAESLSVGSKCYISLKVPSLKTGYYDLSKQPVVTDNGENETLEVTNRTLKRYCDSFFTDIFSIEKIENTGVQTDLMLSVNYNRIYIYTNSQEKMDCISYMKNIHQEYVGMGDFLIFKYEFINPLTLETLVYYVEIGIETMSFNNDNWFSYFKIYQNGTLLVHTIFIDALVEDDTSFDIIEKSFGSVNLKGYDYIPKCTTYIYDVDNSSSMFDGTLNKYCIATNEEDVPSDMFMILFYLKAQ